MSDFTYRVYLDDKQTIYISDDVAGDERLDDLFGRRGNLKVDVCRKILGTSLQDLPVEFTTTILGLFE